MRKTIALTLFAAMLLSFAACGGNAQSADSATVSNSTDVQEVSASDSQTPEPPEETASTPDEPTSEAPEEVETPSDPILGVYFEDSYTYENEFLGIGCQLDAEWDVFDSAEIAELNGLLTEMMTDEAIAEQLEQDGYVQPFYAQAEEGLVTLNIAVENLGLLYGSLLGEQEYAELAVDQVAPVLEALGLTNVTTEIGTVTFAGSEHAAIYISGTLEDMEFYETLACVKVDRYIASITAGSYLTDLTGEILDMFYGL